jgi:hypothetical protein
MHRDFKELLSVLNAEGVRYLVIGGYAVSLHAQPRATKDLDLLIKPDRNNAVALFRALAEFGAPLEGLSPADFMEHGSFFRMGTPPVMVDILPEIAGVVFDDAWKRRVMAKVDTDTGLQAAFISADDLIIAKLASGRAQDLADVEAMRKAREKTGGSVTGRAARRGQIAAERPGKTK